ncbi:uncharacterized protein KGF55_001205 [Candida pseudojiufengensis]|uniref:uncharacterized protein n=1 Tax=Candida pseudojiufengensis TaxID=497109 RepID=UPI002224E0DE|nr:uncharacterized protein KGF55_001205 [Candida pseudojiufengensis]KAI5965842.1 hypothetical protein KGF55_001205 [Candida pseudojiufengensis]
MSSFDEDQNQIQNNLFEAQLDYDFSIERKKTLKKLSRSIDICCLLEYDEEISDKEILDLDNVLKKEFVKRRAILAKLRIQDVKLKLKKIFKVEGTKDLIQQIDILEREVDINSKELGKIANWSTKDFGLKKELNNESQIKERSIEKAQLLIDLLKIYQEIYYYYSETSISKVNRDLFNEFKDRINQINAKLERFENRERIKSILNL